jgi:hypothetical protein
MKLTIDLPEELYKHIDELSPEYLRGLLHNANIPDGIPTWIPTSVKLPEREGEECTRFVLGWIDYTDFVNYVGPVEYFDVVEYDFSTEEWTCPDDDETHKGRVLAWIPFPLDYEWDREAEWRKH